MKLGTLCYVRKNGKTLMLLRNKKKNDIHEGKWNGLGGKLEPGETPEECVIREVKEESGFEIKNPAMKGIITIPAFDKIPDDWLIYVFVANDFEGELIDSEEGTMEWVDDGKLTTLNVWESDKVFIPWLDNKGIFSAKFIFHDGGKLKDYKVVFYGN